MSENQQTIASLIREAAKNETAFLNTMGGVLEEDDPERIEEFFARLNIPRSAKADDTLVDKSELHSEPTISVTTFQSEMNITDGIQKFLDRHMRKLKWHVAHPAIASARNCVRLYRAMSVVTELRIRRVLALLHTKESLTVEEWGNAREIINRSFREIREATSIVTGNWLDALMATCDQEEVRELLKELPEIISDIINMLKELRDRIEERRKQLEVLPEGYPPVRPPRYFGGDLLDTNSWRYLWDEFSSMNNALRSVMGL